MDNFDEWKTLNSDYPPDEAMTRFLTIEYGVTPIPCNAFYETDNPEKYQFLRFAICKKTEDILSLFKKLPLWIINKFLKR